MTVEIRRTAKGPTLEEYKRRIAAMDGRTVKAGVVGDRATRPFIDRHDGSSVGKNVAEIAAIHEFGAGVPNRPFMQITFGRQLSAIKRKARVLGVDTLKGDGRAALLAIGEDFADVAKDTIESAGYLDPIARPVETIKVRTGPLLGRRRDERYIPLFDTGQILASIGAKEG